MIKFENTEVFNFEGAIRGMRQPMNSHNKSDSLKCDGIDIDCGTCENCKAKYLRNYGEYSCYYDGQYIIGENDLNLMKRLIKAGADHRKFTRQIMVSVDITAPDYWFKEYDTYKIGTVANSTSTMHKIMSKEFTADMFSMDCVTEISGENPDFTIQQCVLNLLNNYRNEYLKTKDNNVWKALIQLLPMSFNYTRTCTLNYEVIWNMYKSRKNHKLTEWSDGFVQWAESLPYFKELFIEN